MTATTAFEGHNLVQGAGHQLGRTAGPRTALRSMEVLGTMGLFDFVKDAGASLLQKVGIGGPDEKQLGEALTRNVKELGLEVQDLNIEVAGDVASVQGKTQSQADREKVVLAVGNTKGIAQVNDRLEVMKAEPEAAFYTVVSGDTLSKIAKTHYGNPGKYPVIFEANRPMLTHPDKIYPGQKLRIPPQV